MTTPKMMIFNGFAVPAPLQEIPPCTTHVWKADPNHPELATRWTVAWIGDDLEKGLVYLTKEDAQALAKAMRGIDPGVQP